MSSKTRKQRGRGGKMGKLGAVGALAGLAAYRDHHRYSQGPSSGVVSENVNEFGIGRVGEDLGNTPPGTYAGEWEQWDKNSRNERTGTKKKKNKKRQKTKKKKKDKKKKPPRNKDVGPEVHRKWKDGQNGEREGNKSAQQALMLGAAAAAAGTGALFYTAQQAANDEAARVEAAREEAARVRRLREEAQQREQQRAATLEAARVQARNIRRAREEAARVEAARVEAARVEAARVEAARRRRQRQPYPTHRDEGKFDPNQGETKTSNPVRQPYPTHRDEGKFDPNQGETKTSNPGPKKCTTGENGLTCGNHGTAAGTYTGTNKAGCSCICRNSYTGANCTTPPPLRRPFTGNINDLKSNAIPEHCISVVKTEINTYLNIKNKLLRALNNPTKSFAFIRKILAQTDKRLVAIKSKFDNGDNSTNPPCTGPIISTGEFNRYWRDWMNSEAQIIENAIRSRDPVLLNRRFTRYGGRKRTRKRKSRKRKSRKKRKSRRKKKRKTRKR
jgi:hypothetical protein